MTSSAPFDDALLALRRAQQSYAVADDILLALGRRVAEVQRLAAMHAALIAGEIARRSAPALGSTGLAQRTGHRTPEELVRVTTGSTRRDARVAVAVGVLAESPTPEFEPVAAAITAGTLSVDGASAIMTGLGAPTSEITSALLRAAAATLCTLSLDPDRLLRAARDARDALDEAGIVDREAALHARRSLRFWRTPDGGGQLHWVMDAETAASVGDLFDRATSPRRGGPRCVNVADKTRAQTILDDTRTTEQIASDTFAHLLTSGAGADSAQLLGTGGPTVRILVTAESLATRTGHGRIEGSPAPISLATAERLACTGSTVTVIFDDTGQAIDVGREQRLYTRRQRIALATRDGGCRWPGCERPPSWTEAHHTRFWARDTGKTNIEDGILLCTHHHLLCHNNGWEITHEGGDYWLVPPPTIDPQQTPVAMHTKSDTLRELLGPRVHARGHEQHPAPSHA